MSVWIESALDPSLPSLFLRPNPEKAAPDKRDTNWFGCWRLSALDYSADTKRKQANLYIL